METVYQKRSVGCTVSDPTYNEVMKVAARRGITVSELIRYYVEEGLSNPTPREIRRLNDRLSLMEGLLKELYEMAVVNWAQVKHEAPAAPKPPLPWVPGYFEAWKKQLASKGLVNEKTGKSAFEELKDRSGYFDNDGVPDSMGDRETDELLRDMWKADGSWTEEEEADYQQKLKAKRVPAYTRSSKAASKPQKAKPAGKAAKTEKKKAAKKRAPATTKAKRIED